MKIEGTILLKISAFWGSSNGEPVQSISKTFYVVDKPEPPTVFSHNSFACLKHNVLMHL